MRRPLQSLVFLVFVIATQSFGPVSARAQSSSVAVPAEAFVGSVWNPQVTLRSEFGKWMPTEIADAWLKKSLGASLASVQRYTGWIAPAQGETGAPLTGFVVSFSTPVDLSKIDPDLLTEGSVLEKNGRTVYGLQIGPNTMMVFAVDAKNIAFCAPQALEMALSAGESSVDKQSKLQALLDAPAAQKGESRTVVLMDAHREEAKKFLDKALEDLPPQFDTLRKCPDLIDLALIDSLSATDSGNAYRASLRCKNESDAQQLLSILTGAVADGQKHILQLIEDRDDAEGKIQEATTAYLQRIVRHYVGLIDLKREGSEVFMQADVDLSVGTTGILVGLLLPAVQAAREAARRMSASNNLKQIGLALHNHHAVYKELPAPAIKSADGKPLLSWRVKILPFIEQQALYEKFRLDEPWDSPHNIKLLDEMPSVFVDPSLPRMKGKTVFRALVGDDRVFKPEGKSQFRSILDGLSNTIMVVEADASQAIEWTKPDAMEIDLDNPIDQMGHIHMGGFHVLMGDGAVVFITHAIELNLFKALMTSDGGEAIEF